MSKDHLRRAREADRHEEFEEEMEHLRGSASRTTAQSLSLSESSDGDDFDSQPTLGGYNATPGYDAKAANGGYRKRYNEDDAGPSAKMMNMGPPAAGDNGASMGGSKFAMNYLKKFGFKEGEGLGKDGKGIVEPIKAVGHSKRAGLGDERAKVFAQEVGVDWDESVEDKSVEEYPVFIECSADIREDIVVQRSWIKIGAPKDTLDDEDHFCDAELIAKLLKAKSVFDHLTDNELHNARIRANPYETIKSSIFQNRAAVKMANMDKVFEWGLSQEYDETKRHSLRPLAPPNVSTNSLGRESEMWYFADVCAGPGGFSEYLLWRKAYYNCKGFGFTLKGDCDFKLDKFLAASACYFDTYYGPHDDGDVYNPENLIALEKYVKNGTDHKGVHLVTCDGGFSVAGKENIQEILSKRLYLCQFIVGLALNRVSDESSAGGNFVCKLFDLFTPFSVGLVYLMYLAFRKISLHKPVTSRPANSERYIYAEGLTEFGATIVKDHLVEVNKKLDSFKAQGKEAECDVMEVVPLDLIKNDDEFMRYIVDHNESLIKKQTLYLDKYLSFAKNRGRQDLDQGKIREAALEYWELPNIDRKVIQADADKPMSMHFKSLSPREFDIRQHFSKHKPLDLDKWLPAFPPTEVFHHTYFCQLLSSLNPPFLLVSSPKEKPYTLAFDEGGHFKPNYELPNFPQKTILLVESTFRMFNDHRENEVLRIVDAAMLGGDDVSALPLPKRLEYAEKFVQAYVVRKPKLSLSVAQVQYMDPRGFTALADSMFSSPSSAVPFTRRPDEPLYYYPVNGIRLLRVFKSGIHKLMSRSQKVAYLNNVVHKRNINDEDYDKCYSTFWTNIAEGPLLASWKRSHHSETSAKDLLEAESAADVITVKALQAHIEKAVAPFIREFGSLDPDAAA
uniref:Cap-specific mRNA (nucleoside-2'-O-)-methyltransferase 1 n=1 Tax=Panagrellus redivivus TaxID=6233 RepID=A0A7E5A1U6_PANRE